MFKKLLEMVKIARAIQSPTCRVDNGEGFVEVTLEGQWDYGEDGGRVAKLNIGAFARTRPHAVLELVLTLWNQSEAIASGIGKTIYE